MIQLSYVEALLLEEIAQFRAEYVSNRYGSHYYVNNQHADESIVPFLHQLLEKGLLEVKRDRETILYYYVNDEGRKALLHSMLLTPKVA